MALLETPTYSYDSFEKCQLITIIFLKIVIGRGTLKYFLEDINSKIGAAKTSKNIFFCNFLPKWFEGSILFIRNKNVINS